MTDENTELPRDGAQKPGQRFADLLVSENVLSPKDIERAFRLAERQEDTFYAILAKLGLINERELAATYARLMGIAYLPAADFPTEAVDIDEISPRFLQQKRILPLSRTGETCVVAVADPLDQYALDAFRLAVGDEVEIQVSETAAIEKAIEQLYRAEGDRTEDALHADDTFKVDDFDVERLKDMASEAPVVRLVNQLFADAVDQRASDIHLEPFEKEFRVRFRIDGVLEAVETLPDQLRAAVTSRIKIMARLDIAERRLPQDGRAKIIVRGKEIDLRISTIPILHGESVVVRVLDRDTVALDFDRLGVSAQPRKFLDTMTSATNGIYLVTGPTGSGKTTTLYAAMTAIDSVRQKVLTVEDPIEFQLEGINQVQVHAGIGLTFAKLLRAFLRQDPDTIMVGEVRDGETARIAAQAALTGHLVLSTLHTNDAAGAVTRLMDMGVEKFLLAATVSGIAAQRLVRRLCPTCRESYEPTPELRENFGLDRLNQGTPPVLYKAVGCSACRGQGYLGRTVVMETMLMTERLKHLILQDAEHRDIRAAAIDMGMIPLQDDALLKALSGITSLEEVMRTTGDV